MVSLEVDGAGKPFLTDIANYSDFTTSVCGDEDSNDLGAISVRGTFVHSSPTLELAFIGALTAASGAKSWGIRDLILSFGVTNPTIPAEEACGYTSVLALDAENCACGDG